MQTAAILVVVLTTAFSATGGERAPVRPFESAAELNPEGKIDELVFDRLKSLGIQPAHLCSDEVFLRRVYLDVIGTLPEAQEAWQFLKDPNPDNRRVLVDRLLNREEFADYWAMKWSDLLRVKAEFPINLWPRAVHAYHRWIRTSIREDVPYDRFVREMLTASGSSFHVPQVNFYRAVQSREPKAIAGTVALTFMGARADKWPEDRLHGMAAFFSQVGYKSTGEWKEEIVFDDSINSVAGAEDTRELAMFPDGRSAPWPPGKDRREVFADWLIALADGSITSPFLELFGRPPRDTGFESERNNRPTGDQRLHLLNSRHIQAKIQTSSTLSSLAGYSRNRREAESRLYLTILSRLPTEEESATIREYSQSGKLKPPADLLDVAWALINSPEFLYRH